MIGSRTFIVALLGNLCACAAVGGDDGQTTTRTAPSSDGGEASGTGADAGSTPTTGEAGDNTGGSVTSASATSSTGASASAVTTDITTTSAGTGTTAGGSTSTGTTTANTTSTGGTSGSSSSSTATTGTTGTTSASSTTTGTTGGEAFCACYEREVGNDTAKACRAVESDTCVVDADCCPASTIGGVDCPGEYPYLYECRGGTCHTRGCSGDAECDPYALATGTTSLGCVDVGWPCGDSQSYCSYRTGPACVVDDDCCPDPGQILAGFTCQVDYPYRYNCDAGTCKTRDCTDGSQCQKWADQVGTQNLGCSTIDPLSCYSLADAPPSPGSFDVCDFGNAHVDCVADDDCCSTPMPAGYVCQQDYPYRYSCTEGRCINRACETDTHCDALAALTMKPYRCE